MVSELKQGDNLDSATNELSVIEALDDGLRLVRPNNPKGMVPKIGGYIKVKCLFFK
uniref:Uncharacterized protein n=1 Tax=Vitis vinifera TaxID=29760 RepID=F6HXJ7_VITVI